MQLRLRSRITKKREFDSIDLSRFAVPLKCDKERYEQDLKSFCRRYSQTVDADDAAPDDMVTIRCAGASPRFKKDSITVRAGLGLYSKELEEGIIGMKVGESRDIPAEGDMVNVTVLSSRRQIIPALDDELAKKSGIPGINCAADAMRACRFKQYDDALDNVFDDAFEYFSGELINTSEFSFDDEEMRAAVSCSKKSMSADALENDKCDEFAEKLGHSMLIAALFGQDMAELTQKDYESYIEKVVRAAECTAREAIEDAPLSEYLIFEYSDVFIDKAEKYVLDRLKTLGEEMQ